MSKIKDASGWTMFVFGVLALLSGLLGLLRLELLLSALGFSVLERTARATGDFTLVFMTASAMASFNLVLTDMRDTNVGGDLIPAMNAASTATKNHIRKTAVLGVTGMKRKLGDLLTALTGQQLKYFDDIELAKIWLVEDEE